MNKITGFKFAFIALIFTFTCHAQSTFNIVPDDKEVSFIFSPGMNSSPVQMSKYCPNFTTEYGDLVKCDVAGKVIDGACQSGVVYQEINLEKPELTWNVGKILAYPFQRLIRNLVYNNQSNRFHFTVEPDPSSKNSVAGHFFNPMKNNLAQEKDIEYINKKYLQHREKFKDKKIVIYGVSRGAATAVTFTAVKKPDVAAVVAEGAFDSIAGIIDQYYPKTKKFFGGTGMIYKTFAKLIDHKAEGISPLSVADQFPHQVPLLLITSLADEVVPYQSTLNLYKKIKVSGHPNVHLLVLKKSTHNGYMLENEEDKARYERTVHAFYRKNNLPHNEELAKLGEEELNYVPQE